jgi:hypothetical protein
MLKVIGFLLEFKNKASKGIEKITKDTLHLDKVWKKGTKTMKGWTKGMGAQFDTLKARTAKFFMDSKSGIFDFSDALEKLESGFGERARAIAEKLLSPQAAILAFGGFAVKAGLDFEKVMRQIRLETGATGTDLEEFGGVAKHVAFDIGTGFGQVANVMGLLAARMGLTDEKAELLAETAMRAARVSNVEVQTILGGMMEMYGALGMGADELHSAFSGAVSVAQTTRRGLDDVVAGAMSFSQLISEVPKHMQAQILPQLIQLSGAMGDVFVDSESLVTQLTKAVAQPGGPEWRELQFIFGQGGKDAVDAFNEAVDTGDIRKAFAGLIQSAQKMQKSGDLDAFKKLAFAMKDVLGVDPGTLDRLSRVQLATLDKVVGKYQDAASNAQFLVEQDEKTLTLTQRMWKVLNKIMVILVPIGAILVQIGHHLVTAVEWVLEGLRSIMDIPIIGTFLAWAGAAVVIGVLIGAIVVAVKILFGVVVALVTALIPIIVVALKIALIVVAIVAAAWVLWKVLKFVAEIAWVILRPFYELAKIIVLVLVGALIGLGILIWDYLIKPVADFLAPAFWFVIQVIIEVGKAIATIGKWIYTSIIKPIWDFVVAIFDKIKDISSWLAEAGSDTFSFLTFGVFDSEESAPGAAKGGIVMPSPGGSLINVAEGGKPEIIADPNLMRKIIGADDIIDAIWGAAEMMVTQLTSPTANTAPGYQPNYAESASFSTQLASSTSHDR